MMKFQKQLALVGIVTGVFTLGLSSVASAHVVVRPAETVTAGFQTFTVGVPNEKDIPTAEVRLEMPSGLNHVSPTQKAGWDIDVETSGAGEDTVVTAITWNDGTVGVGLREDFTFSAQVPAEPTELQWKAYQTYTDGTLVSWDQASEGDHGEGEENIGPFSVTSVVETTETDAAVENAQQAAADAESSARLALYVGIAGVAFGLLGVALATRKK